MFVMHYKLFYKMSFFFIIVFFLLLACPNINFDRWVTEYRIDGFQFHSLSSMIYTHNGFATFTGAMEE